MRTNIALSAILKYHERLRQENLKSWRAEALEKTVIPNQERLIHYAKRHGLSTLADENILVGMKREYQSLTGRRYA